MGMYRFYNKHKHRFMHIEEDYYLGYRDLKKCQGDEDDRNIIRCYYGITSMGYREAIVEIDYEAITCLEEFMSISYRDLKYLFENSFSGIMYGLSYSDIRSDFYDAYEQFVVATDFRNYSNLYDIDSYKKYFYKYDRDMAYINVQIMEEENRQRIKKADGEDNIGIITEKECKRFINGVYSAFCDFLDHYKENREKEEKEYYDRLKQRYNINF